MCRVSPPHTPHSPAQAPAPAAAHLLVVERVTPQHLECGVEVDGGGRIKEEAAHGFHAEGGSSALLAWVGNIQGRPGLRFDAGLMVLGVGVRGPGQWR